MKCNKCRVDLALDDTIKCTSCQDKLHYACAGLSEIEFKKILPMNIKKWKCPNCKQLKKSSTSSTPTASTPRSPLILNEVAGENTDGLPSIVSIDTGALLSSMNNQFQQISRDMIELKDSFHESLNALTFSIQTLAEKFQELETNVSNVQTEIAGVKAENAALREQLEHLHDIIDEQEQKSRQCNIEIQNLPVQPSENLVHMTLALGKLLNVPITTESIRTVHRVAHNTKSDRPKNIIVELCSRRLRDDVIAAARARRGVTAGQILQAARGPVASTSSVPPPAPDEDNRPVYINEHLTLKNKILHSKTRNMANTKNYKWVWIKNAAILVRKSDSSSVIRIRKEADLAKL